MSSDAAGGSRDSELAIEVDGLTKSYRTYARPRDRLRELLSPSRQRFHHKVHALSDVSFTLRRGGRLGIVGENGSGKSTLLKVLAGVLSPSQGVVAVDGRVSALLELGTGFSGDLSGRENIAQFCMLHGLGVEESREAIPAIIAFSELAQAIDNPVKTYSSGMGLRLGFACAVYVQPDILIVDEALAVGDAYFQNKCQQKIKSLLDGGTTFIYVTHAADSVRTLCDEGLWLADGKVVMHDDSAAVGRAYDAAIFKKLSGAGRAEKAVSRKRLPVAVSEVSSAAPAMTTPSISFADRVAPLRTGSGEIRIHDIVLLDPDGDETDTIDFDREHLVRVVVDVLEAVPSRTALTLGVTDQTGRQLVHVNSLDHGIDLHAFRAGSQEVVEMTYRCPLCPGEYGLISGITTMTENPLRRKQLLVEQVIDYCVGGARFAIRYPMDQEGRDLWGLVAVKANVLSYSAN